MEGYQQSNLILAQKWKDLSIWIFENVLRGMPKSERFSLGADIRRVVWEVQADCVQLALHFGQRRLLLNHVDVQSKVLLSMVELGIAVGAVPEKRIKTIADKISEIGRIVGGLLKVRQ